jgi:hypothetical protein
MHLIRDILDKQLVDRNEDRLGRVDSILVELRNAAPPRVTEFELGFVPLARRLSVRLERLATALHKRFAVRRSARYGIPWSLVTDVTIHHIQVDVIAEDTVAYDWEHWLRRNFAERLGGGSSESSE